MIDTIIKTIGCLVIYLAISVPMQVTANRCKCSPKEWDFGDVSIGSSSTVIFSLTNFEPTEIAIRNIMIASNPIADINTQFSSHYPFPI